MINFFKLNLYYKLTKSKTQILYSVFCIISTIREKIPRRLPWAVYVTAYVSNPPCAPRSSCGISESFQGESFQALYADKISGSGCPWKRGVEECSYLRKIILCQSRLLGGNQNILKGQMDLKHFCF